MLSLEAVVKAEIRCTAMTEPRTAKAGIQSMVRTALRIAKVVTLFMGQTGPLIVKAAIQLTARMEQPTAASVIQLTVPTERPVGKLAIQRTAIEHFCPLRFGQNGDRVEPIRRCVIAEGVEVLASAERTVLLREPFKP